MCRGSRRQHPLADRRAVVSPSTNRASLFTVGRAQDDIDTNVIAEAVRHPSTTTRRALASRSPSAGATSTSTRHVSQSPHRASAAALLRVLASVLGVVPLRRISQVRPVLRHRADIKLLVDGALSVVTSILVEVARRRPSRKTGAQVLEHALMMARHGAADKRGSFSTWKSSRAHALPTASGESGETEGNGREVNPVASRSGAPRETAGCRRLAPQTSALTRLRHAPRPSHPSGHPEPIECASMESLGRRARTRRRFRGGGRGDGRPVGKVWTLTKTDHSQRRRVTYGDSFAGGPLLCTTTSANASQATAGSTHQDHRS